MCHMSIYEMIMRPEIQRMGLAPKERYIIRSEDSNDQLGKRADLLQKYSL